MPDQITGLPLRRYDPAQDAAAIVELVHAVWGGAGFAVVEQRYGLVAGKPWRQWIADHVLADLNSDQTCAFVVHDDQGLAGFCSYTLDRPRSRGTVGYNAIARRQQGRGLGSALLRFVLARLRAEGMSYAGVIVAEDEDHAPARRMYEKAGFEFIARSAYLMQKL